MSEKTKKTPPPFRVTVFCSANVGLNPAFIQAAQLFSQGLAARNWELLYGGARAGLMGEFASSALAAGAAVRGAITEGLARNQEIPHRGLSELVMSKDLFERKKWMMENGDAFVIFPGGFGTLDEALEVITWKSLGHHRKPILFVNLDGFWQAQLTAFAGFARDGMIRKGGLELYQVCETLNEVWKILDECEKP
jgi:uncharacterized protein (TIGR00730 family)